MNCLSKLNTKTFVAASLLAGAGVTFASVGIAKGYNLSPLETYIIESFAQEQIDGFINSGATTFFESPKIFYITPRALARQVKTDLSGAQKKYLGNYGIVKSFVSKTNKDKTRVQFDIPKPDYTLDLKMQIRIWRKKSAPESVTAFIARLLLSISLPPSFQAAFR